MVVTTNVYTFYYQPIKEGSSQQLSFAPFLILLLMIYSINAEGLLDLQPN